MGFNYLPTVNVVTLDRIVFEQDHMVATMSVLRDLCSVAPNVPKSMLITDDHLTTYFTYYDCTCLESNTDKVQ